MIDSLSKIIDFDYRFKIKLKLIVPVIIIIITSLILLNYSNIEKKFLFYNQIRWIFLGLIFFIFFSYIKIEFIYKNLYKFYFLIICLLIMTLLFGVSINNSQRWLSLGFMFQPSEIGKLLFIFFIATFLKNRPKNYSDFKTIFIILIPTLFIAFLILRQPDLGTSLVYLFIIFPMLLVSGVRLISIILFISPIISF